MSEKDSCRSKMDCPFEKTWSFLTLVVGYPFAAAQLLYDKRSPRRLKSDLVSDEGKRIAREWGDSLIVALVLALVIRTFLLQPFRIPSGSMRPTLIEGDHLFVNKLRYGSLVPLTGYRLPGFGKPERGDVVVFREPLARQKDFIKRLIAFGGETVEIKDGRILINGVPVDVPPIRAVSYMNAGDYGAVSRPITVPAGHIFVLGDNTRSSHDSRYWGFVPETLLIGRAESIFWPVGRVRWIR